MKLQILTSLLLVGLCCPVYGDLWRSGCDQGSQGNVNDDDDEKHMYKPCGDSGDLHCIKDFLASHGYCDHQHVHTDSREVHMPVLNLTITHMKAKMSGLENGKVQKFYINKRTGKLIMAVDFKAIGLKTEKTFYEFHRPGQEPVVTGDYLSATYAALLTAVIPLHSGANLNNARVTAYIPHGEIDYHLGPQIVSKDPTVARTFAHLKARFPIALQEAFLSEAPVYFVLYVQHICG